MTFPFWHQAAQGLAAAADSLVHLGRAESIAALLVFEICFAGVLAIRWLTRPARPMEHATAAPAPLDLARQHTD